MIVAAFLIGMQAPRAIAPVFRDPPIRVIMPSRVAPPAKTDAGGSGRDQLPQSQGSPQPRRKFNAPMTLASAQPKLTLEIGLLESEKPAIFDVPGNPLANSKIPSLGIGRGHDGTGDGDCCGDGSGKGKGVSGAKQLITGTVKKLLRSLPRLIYQEDPEYSEEARKARHQGTVVLSLRVDSSGKPQDIQVVRALGLGLDEKAIQAVSKWRFQPALENGRAVSAPATIEVNFRLL